MIDDRSLIRLSRVSKIFKIDSVEVKAVDDVSLEVKRGEFVAIMGPSGCGKSTLMYLIGCLDKPTSGQIIFEGKDVSSLSELELARIRNEKIGFVFQMFNLLPRTTALANVELPLIYHHLGKKERDERALKTLETVGLSDRVFHFPSQLSGGQQQKVAIARALINDPSFILADEPTGNLDSKSGKEIMAFFQKLNKDGHTIIVVTHDKEVAKYSQKIILMRDGRIIRNR